MADSVGMADIRGIDIDKLAKGFADEEFIFKKFVTVTPTGAREIRWYQKTSGTLSATSPSVVANSSALGVPTHLEQTWTRNTSYVRTYSVSGFINRQDISDSDPDVLATTIRDLTRAVASQVDTRIWNVVTENLSPSNINTTAATQDGWDDTATGNPILDLLTGARKIRAQGYDISNIVVLINPVEYQNLLNYIISVKGSSIPAMASDTAGSGVLMQVVGQKIVVSNNATTDYALQMIPNRAATWKTFTPITARTEEVLGMGQRIVVYEDGECILTDPKAVHLITDTVT